MRSNCGLTFQAVAALALLVACAESCKLEGAGEQSGHVDGGAARSPIASNLVGPEPVVPPWPSGKGSPSSARSSAACRCGVHEDFLEKPHVGDAAWTDVQWHARCRGVRTTYNPNEDLREDALTIRPSEPRWLDFVFWTLSNKVNEHQVEAYGGNGWNGPKGGVLFHWAPGSHWERDTLHSFGFTIGHVVGEHRWTDTMFPDFFEKYGGVYGVNVKDRLAEIAPGNSGPWVDFLEYQAGANSPYSRYLLHIDSSVDVSQHLVALAAGQGIAFYYSFDRLYHELSMILTDCKAVDFFQMYDRFGPGFAAEGNWANQQMPLSALLRVGYAGGLRFATGLGGGGGTPETAEPSVPESVDIPADLPEADRMRKGERVYFAQCVDCHGATGDGAGFLAEGFDVMPRDFRQGTYEFRATRWGQLPTMADVERSVREGVPDTTMPAWGQFLTDEQIRDVARFLVVFSPRFVAAWRSHEEAEPLPIGQTPANLGSLASRGEGVWHFHQCGWCHGEDGRGDGRSAPGLQDDWKHPIRPADLTYKWLFKDGYRPEDVYRSIFGGLNGTPMGSYLADVPDDEDRWALVAYVLSLSPASRPVLTLGDFARQRATRIGPNGRVLPPMR